MHTTTQAARLREKAASTNATGSGRKNTPGKLFATARGHSRSPQSSRADSQPRITAA